MTIILARLCCVTKTVVVLSTMLDCSFKFFFATCIYLFTWPALQYSVLKCYTSHPFSFFWTLQLFVCENFFQRKQIYINYLKLCQCIIEGYPCWLLWATSKIMASPVTCFTPYNLQYKDIYIYIFQLV